MQGFLQERFVDILQNPEDIAEGKVLQYDSNGDLRCVIPTTGGILAQVVAYVDADALEAGDYVESVTCVGNGVTQTGINQNGKYIFTIPSLGTYTITATSHSGITASEVVDVTIVKQYLVNIWLHAEISNTLDENSWKVIQGVTRHGIASSYWNLGDKKNITLSAGQIGPNTYVNTNLYYVFIIGFDHNTNIETNGRSTITFQMAKFYDSGTLVDICMICPGYYTQQTSATTGFFMVPYPSRTDPSYLAWSGSYMRTTLCPQFYNLLSLDLRSVIINCSKYSTNSISGYNTSSPSYVASFQEETVFILSEKELFGNVSAGPSVEASNDMQKQYLYYYDSVSGFKNLFKTPIGDALTPQLKNTSFYYTRTPYSNGGFTDGYVCVDYTSVITRSQGVPGFQGGFTPAFVIG